MHILQISILLCLGFIFLHDLLKRLVSLILLLFLTILLITLRITEGQPLTEFWTAGFNIGFIIVQLILLTLFFSLKNGRLINITEKHLGWGDIAIYLPIAVYLTIPSFVLFYLLSLIIILIAMVPLRLFPLRTSQYVFIPQAGYQALLLGIWLGVSWWVLDTPLRVDLWFLEKMTP